MHHAREWERRYGRKLFVTDVIVVIIAVFGAQLVRFGITAAELQISPTNQSDFAIRYTTVSLLLIALWLILLSVVDSRDSKIFGAGASEYKRVVNATMFTFGAWAVVSYLLRAELGRGYVLIALPTGLTLLLVSRWLWRKRLHQQRRRGRNGYRTLIVGEPNKCRHVAAEITRETYPGFELVGAVSSSSQRGELSPGVPYVADYENVLTAVDELDVDTIVMISSDSIAPARMRELGWEFEARNIDMVVAAALTDVAGPRIHMRPVANLPLIHVDYPKFVGRKRVAKRVFDLLASSLLILLSSPLLIVIALLVRFTSSGPVLFKQERIGLDGKPFHMLKFRSMVVDAEERLADLLNDTDGNGVLFKMKNDPRVTRVGAVLRKYSLDELPQLFNVLGGSMSLVGPRPPLPREVEVYEEWVHRRLLVKPGITGLWQVSGRSNLSWEDSVRLDLYYVENWSITGDLLLLFRTIKTVLRPEGAY